MALGMALRRLEGKLRLMLGEVVGAAPREVPCAAEEAEEAEETDQQQETFAAEATHSATHAP